MCERGSIWRKWDFHVHTPYSILNNGFGFEPDFDYEKDETAFDEYVMNLFNKAIEQEVYAIGLTDYFSFEGYKRVRTKYLENQEKMQHLFPDSSVRERIRRIFVFPNIELRSARFIGKDSKPLNYHVLFSDKVAVEDIEDLFFGKINIGNGSDKLPLKRNNIERLGREYKEHNTTKANDYLAGMQQITVDENEVVDILKSSRLKNDFLISIPVDEDLSHNVPWKGRDASVRINIYRICNCFMTSNQATREWALGRDGVKAQIEEFGALKPCIWGSDAHDYESMYRPAENRFCWVKAEPSFEGLRQILFEPAERVFIQEQCPEEKDSHHIIDRIEFDDDRFQKEPIYFSEGLSTIIGGKSTGKSIILRHIELGTDSKQVHEKEKEMIENGAPNKLQVNAKVFWKDGVSDERSIVYIPQSWLNRVVDNKYGDNQLNSMLRKVLLQQPDVAAANEQLIEKMTQLGIQTKSYISEYSDCTKRIQEAEKKLKENGRSEAFKSTIDQLEAERKQLSSEVGIDDKLIQKYATLRDEIRENNRNLFKLQHEKDSLVGINKAYAFIPNITETIPGEHKHVFSAFDSIKEFLEKNASRIDAVVSSEWKKVLSKAEEDIEVRITEIKAKNRELSQVFTPLEDQVLKTTKLKDIEVRIQEEKEKYLEAIQNEQDVLENRTQKKALTQRLLDVREDTMNAYKEFASIVEEKNPSESELRFSAEVVVRSKDLFEEINSIFDGRNTRSFNEDGYTLTDQDRFKADNGLFVAIMKQIEKGNLGFKSAYNLTSALERMFEDWFHIHYSISSGNDTINQMSPGMKALVLLELIINLDQGKNPILIDQPEDDLDNRSIYSELVAYLKEKKRERQIIVATHNANVVIGADAEEVIIANQEGKDSENNAHQFEYRCGGIECITPNYDERGRIRKGILNQKGIKEQICDILEGGREAFEKRQNKYMQQRT